MIDPQTSAAKAHWRARIRLILLMLVFWFVASLGCGILWADTLNQIRLGGYKLGFWFAQQGAIFTFLALIWTYSRMTDKLEEKYESVDEDLGGEIWLESMSEAETVANEEGPP